MERNFNKLEKKLGVTFKNKKLLQQSFIHRSFLNENRNFPLENNERLEFLGDAVLELIVTEYIYGEYPNPEGELTNWRSSLVNGNMLSKISRKLEFEKYLYLSRGEQKDKGRARELLLANCFEAVVGAIYLDKGYEAAKVFIKKNLIVKLPQIIEKKLFIDPKSKFQELSQEKTGITPTYKVLKEHGPDHNKYFAVGAYIGKEQVGIGEGASKQDAQTKAAEEALKKKSWT
ncbi:MAG: hypothetical protein ACD_63C00028G0002 [uncultured bacterium]|nr:MAG: hypothetical protein ACD_63C00028G0002 [uncultured bacterium]